MAHYAELNENNEVIYVIYIENEKITDDNGNEVEQLGIDHLHTHHGKNRRWVRTSYNENFRANYASEGYIYDEDLDVFIPPKPTEFPSSVLNQKTFKWEHPVKEPDFTEEQMNDELYYYYYIWDEKLYEETNTTGWILKKILKSEVPLDLRPDR